MSRITFQTPWHGKRAIVIAGWDRPLSEYFMTVQNLDHDPDREDDENGDLVLYSTLTGCDDGTLDYMEEAFIQHGVTAPDGFYERLRLCEGNVYHEHTREGWVRL